MASWRSRRQPQVIQTQSPPFKICLEVDGFVLLMEGWELCASVLGLPPEASFLNRL